MKTSPADSSLLYANRQATVPPMGFFPGFERRKIQTSGATIHVLRGGSGPPRLLLHGYPQTHVEWHKIGLQLAQGITVVLTDLRGYGDSSKPVEARITPTIRRG